MMAKAKGKRKAPSPIEQIDGPTPEQFSKGGYDRVAMPNPEGGNRAAVVHINRGGTPVMRWIEDGRMSPSQERAIMHCLYLWRLCGLEQRTTANYGERIPGYADSEARSSNEIEAREDLHRIRDYFPGHYWSIFENVVRFDEPAGIAGSKLGFGTRSASDRAHQVVCFVADVIAWKERLV